MRPLKLALAVLLVGAAPAGVPSGKFQKWLSWEKTPLDFTSDGLTVHVEASPCPVQPVGDSSCRWDGFNNQAAVTITAAGMAPITVTTDPQSAYARIAVVRFDRRDPRPGVVIESQYGGSGGDLTVQMLAPVGDRYVMVPLASADAASMQDAIADFPRDLSGDGRIDFKLEDGRFDSVFGCNACTPRPPIYVAVRNDQLVDDSRDPALRSLFAADMARLAPQCLSRNRYRNGACAAYVADAARAGRFGQAWAAMLKHYERGSVLWEPCTLPRAAWTDDRCPEASVTRFHDFPQSLRAFLTRTGYLDRRPALPRRP